MDNIGTALRLVVILASLLVSNGVAQEDSHSRTVRVASISFEPVKFDLDGNAKNLEAWFRKAAKGGAKIAVAPEGILEGYVVNIIIAGEAAAERMRAVAVTTDSPIIKRFQTLACELEICLAFGFAERIDEDVFNCAIFIDHDGNIRGKYHKMQFAEGYDDRWWFNRLGKQSRAFDTPYGRCGFLICNDRWNPLLAAIPAKDGAQFLIIPSYGSTSTSQDEAVLSRGVETGLPIIEANVGVSLIVNDNKVTAVSRERTGLTFAEITIQNERPIDEDARNKVESEFLQWRENEMPNRLFEHMKRLEKSAQLK
jgi:predicted amidohydrolase